MSKPPLKDYQAVGFEALKGKLTANPGKPVLGVGPCGCGKSRLMEELCEWTLASSRRAGIITHRQMLTEQLEEDFIEHDVPYSVFAAGHKYDSTQPINIISAPTLFARCFRNGTHDLPDLDLLLIDEAHQQTGKQAQALIWGSISEQNMVMSGYIARGASVAGMTATPTIREGLYADMVEFGSYSDMRRAGMHQIVKVYSPDEIDVSKLKASTTEGNYSEAALDKKVKGNMAIYGSVLKEYNRLNPDRLPAILFAPSVASSMWFASCMCNEGIPTAHLCGKYIGWPNMMSSIGNRLEWSESTPEARKELMAAHKSGEIKMITNRFVLREAVNMPWCYHAIFATVMGGLSTYLQAVGRLQRFWPHYEYKILQCHGGHYWRHGSPNEDRVWKLGDTNKSLGLARMKACAKGERPEGIRCPRCGAWRLRGPICLDCGHAHTESFRAIRQVNGKLKTMEGRVFVKVPPTEQEASVNAKWRKVLWGSSCADRPVSAACGILDRWARSKGLQVNWRELPDAPPSPFESDYHKSVNEVYPFMARRTANAKRKKA